MPAAKIAKLAKPQVELKNIDEFKEVVGHITSMMRKLDRAEDTLTRRKKAATKKHDEAVKPTLTELTPLFDQAFWYAYTHWNDLVTGRARESVQLDDAEFKRYIDRTGTHVVNHEVAVQYLRNIESSDFAIKLRQTADEATANALLRRLKRLVTVKTIHEVDTEKLKEFLRSPEAVEIEGATITYTNRLTLIPTQTPSQKARGRKPTTTVRQIP